MEPDFAVDVSTPGRVALSGELDLPAASTLTELLATYDGAAVDVDLRAVTFIDSSGLQGLLRARRDHQALRITNPSPSVARLIAITGLESLIFDETSDTASS